jgi:hypothetical protein
MKRMAGNSRRWLLGWMVLALSAGAGAVPLAREDGYIVVTGTPR